jgi:pimeloyl-ACP methyl ester carboxylesterase
MENYISKIHQWLGIPYTLASHTKGSGPTIIMLHGIATSSVSWDRMVPYLQNNFKCVTIDLLGFGDSPKPDWYSYTPDEHIKNIHHTIKKLKVKGPIIIVGHSMGSLLALHYANKYPNKIKALIMLSPPIYLTKADAEKARKVWRDTLYAKAYKYIRTHKNFTLNNVRRLKALALKNNPFSITEDTWLAFSKSLEECIEKQNVVKDLEQLNCPIYVYYGTLDQLLIKRNIRKVFKRNNVEIHDLRNGHLINDKYAREVSQNILNIQKNNM